MRRLYDKMVIWKRWTQVLQSGAKIEDYFLKRGISKIAVYGMGDIGDFLVESLSKTEIDVIFTIDKERCISKYDIPMYLPNEIPETIEMIVVTPITSFDLIYDSISKIIDKKVDIVGIDEILISLLL